MGTKKVTKMGSSFAKGGRAAEASLQKKVMAAKPKSGMTKTFPKQKTSLRP
jgi:hypothetical protein